MPFLLPLTMPLPLAFALRSRAASGEGSEYLIGADAAFVLGAELFACWVSSEPALNSTIRTSVASRRRCRGPSMGSADALRPRSNGVICDMEAAAAKPKAKVLPKPGFAKARAAAAKVRVREYGDMSIFLQRASSPPAPMGPTTAKTVADPASRRSVRRLYGRPDVREDPFRRKSALLPKCRAPQEADNSVIAICCFVCALGHEVDAALGACSPCPVLRALAWRLFRLAISHLEDVSCHRSPSQGYLCKHEVRAWRHQVELRHKRLLVSRVHRQLPTRTSRTDYSANNAVQALRRLVDLKEVICQEDRAKSPQLPGSSVLVHSIASEELFPPAAEAASTACSPSLYSAGAAGGGGGGSSTTDERMRQLVLENQALREAFGDTQKRLMELEDERQCFLDEGVYDVVNSICGQTGLSPKAGLTGLMGDADNHTKTNGDAGAITFHIGSVDPSADLLALAGSPVAPPPSADLLALAGSPAALPLSPLSLAQMVARRSEQDLRSAELSGENDKLRRELERTTKILEVLEQQRHLAEDKMLALEQEHAVLVRRLAEMEGGARSELSSGSFEVGTV
eukprot:s158_g23.t1